MQSVGGRRRNRITPPTRRLVIRKTNSHRDLRPITERITLEKVLGLSVSSNAALACNPVNGLIAYPAGCAVVLFNPRRNKQSFALSNSKKTITCLTFSEDGKYFATGESGHMPSVRVWDADEPSHPQITELEKGHKYGVSCVRFTPNMKYLVSVGYQHDMLVNIWNWKNGTKVACNKVSTKVYALAFAENSSYFVTAGVRHVKFWYLDTESSKSKLGKTIPIMGRSALLGEQRNNHFCDVKCGVGSNAGSTFCVTSSGVLCCFSEKRVLDKWVELRASKALCIAVNEEYVFCGCTDGIVRVFDPPTLQFVATIPKPHFLGVNVSDGLDPSHVISKSENAMYPDTIAMALDTLNNRLTCVYNDRSLYTWDIKDIKKIGKTWSSLYHNACVWGVEVYPEVDDNKQAALPPGSFLTCSNDDTIRVWNVTEGTNVSFQRNIYSKELMRIIYMDSDGTKSLKDTDNVPGLKNARDSSTDGRSGVRSLRISPDGQHLAAGDRSGNVRVYDLMFFDELIKIEAHESEVLCVEFSPPESGYKLLASAGRDRLIHIFDCGKDFSLIQTLDDHSASITSVKFNVTENDDLQLLSCSADKSIIFRSAQQNLDLQFVRSTNYVGKTTFYDMDIDPTSKYAATACQDRNLRVYDVINGKQSKCYKGAQADDGTLVKIALDSSGIYAATSCSDKSLWLYEFDTGECLASMSGHSEIVTGLKFTSDCKALVSVSGDGCIFLWRIPTSYSQNMVERLVEMGQEPPRDPQPGTPIRRETYAVPRPRVMNGISEDKDLVSDVSSVSEEDLQVQDVQDNEISFDVPLGSTKDVQQQELSPTPPSLDYRFSIGQLPSWAKKQLITSETVSSSVSPEFDNSGHAQPAGRWAQRANSTSLTMVSEISPTRPVVLKLDESADRKRFTVEPHSFKEQLETLAHSPLERKCSITLGEDDDLFPANGREQLEADEANAQKNGANAGLVTMSRGSNVGYDPWVRRENSQSTLVPLQTAEEPKLEEVEETNDEDLKESIIYLPASNEDLDIEVARSFQVTAAQKPQKRRLSKHEREMNGDKSSELSIPSDKQQDDNETKEDTSEDDMEDEEAVTPTDDSPEPPTKGEEDVQENKDETEQYFEGLASASTPVKEKAEPIELKSDEESKPSGKYGFSRQSISRRFLSRSQQSTTKNTEPTEAQNGVGEEKTELVIPVSTSSHKEELQRRKEEMARAVDATRRRLEALGWKAKEEITKKFPSSSVSSAATTALISTSTTDATSHSLSSTPAPVVAMTTTTISSLKLSESSRSSSVTSSLVTSSSVTSSSSSVTFLASSVTSSRSSSVSSSPVTSPVSWNRPTSLDLSNISSSFVPITMQDKPQASTKVEHQMAPPLVTQDKKEIKENLVPEKDIAEPQKITRNGSSETFQEKSNKSAADLIAFFTTSKTSAGTPKASKRKEKDISKSPITVKSEETPKTTKQERKLDRKGSSGSLNSEKKSWRKSLGLSGFSSREKKERRGSAPLDLKPGETISSAAKKVQLRDKKGRLSAEERKAKSRSMGDINQKLKTLDEVSILDPTSPITRVVSTTDIPSVVENQSNTALPKAPRLSNIASDTSLSRSSPVRTVELGKPVEVSINISPPAKENIVPLINNQPAEKDVPKGIEEGASLPSAREVSRDPVTFTSPPHPIRLSMSEMNLSSISPPSMDRKLPAGRDQDLAAFRPPIAEEAQEALQNLVKAFKSVADIHNKALEQAQSEEKQRVLAMLSDTFTDMEKEIQTCRHLRRERIGVSPRNSACMENARPLSSVFSFSTSTLDTIRHDEAKTSGGRRQSESTAEPNDPREMLEKYSDILVDLVKQKLTGNKPN